MNQALEHRLRAFFFGVLVGLATLLALLVWTYFTHAYVLKEFVVIGMGQLLAPIAAVTSAIVLGASVGRIAGAGALAFVVAFGAIAMLDFALTIVLFVPGAPGPFQGKPDLSPTEVDELAATWMFGRHIVAYATGLLGGSGLGTWLGARGRR
jgi:hypothetical protein